MSGRRKATGEGVERQQLLQAGVLECQVLEQARHS
jgi:hypothetical protein